MASLLTGAHPPPRVATWPGRPRAVRRWTRSTWLRSRQAAETTAPRDCARTITRTTTAPSSSTRKATTSKRCATGLNERTTLQHETPHRQLPLRRGPLHAHRPDRTDPGLSLHAVPQGPRHGHRHERAGRSLALPA